MWDLFRARSNRMFPSRLWLKRLIKMLFFKIDSFIFSLVIVFVFMPDCQWLKWSIGLLWTSGHILCSIFHGKHESYINPLILLSAFSNFLVFRILYQIIGFWSISYANSYQIAFFKTHQTGHFKETLHF